MGWHQQKSLIKMAMLIEYFHTQSLQNTIHIYLKSTKPNHCIFLYFMKPCMVCLYKKIFATETTTCDPWERGKMYSRLENQICTTEYFEAYCQLDLPSKQI